MQTQRVRFDGSSGAQLVGRLETPDIAQGTPIAYALFAHCFTCSKDLKAVTTITRSLVERGFAVLRFDFTGLGESEGEFAETNFSSNLDDLVAAADFLRNEAEAPSLLIGHSLGGAAVIAAAERIPETLAVATIGAPSDTAHLKEGILEPATDQIEREGEAQVNLAGRRYTIRKQFLDDLSQGRVLSAVRDLGTALLLLHSPVDNIVSIDHAARLYKAAKHPKSFVTLDNADHLLTNPRDAEYVGTLLVAWAGRYIEAEAPAQDQADATPDGEGVWVIGGPEGFRNQVIARQHRLIADEPLTVPGATDTGPTPYEYLLAGLGACTSMTLRMYAERKGWPLEGVRVQLEHDRIHAKDCEDCSSTSGRVDRIQRQLEILGDELDDAQRARLLEIADRCPVHRTLTNEIKIRTRVAGALDGE